MKKVKGVIGAILPFIYAFLVQFVTSLVIMVVYGAAKGISLANQGITDPGEIAKIVEESISQELILLVALMAGIVSIIIFGMWYYKKFGKQNQQKIAKIFEGKALLWIGILGISLQVFLSVVLNIISTVLPTIFEKHAEHMAGLGGKLTLVSVLFISIVAPISEELIFRGIILNKAKRVLPFVYANILQSLLFGIYHRDLIQGLYTFILAMFLGALYERRNSIYAPIVLHMVFNIFGLLVNLASESNSATFKIILGIIVITSVPGIIFSIINLNNNIETDIDIMEDDKALEPGI